MTIIVPFCPFPCLFEIFPLKCKLGLFKVFHWQFHTGLENLLKVDDRKLETLPTQYGDLV